MEVLENKDDSQKGTLAHNLKEVRKDRRMTQPALAEASGVGLATIKDIEGGRSGGSGATIAALAGALRCTLADLYAPEIPKIETAKSKKLDATYLIDAAELLSKLAGLPPRQRRFVLALIYEDDSILNDDDTDSIRDALALLKEP